MRSKAMYPAPVYVATLDDGHAITGVHQALDPILASVGLDLLADEESLQRSALFMIANGYCRRHRNGANLQSADGLHVQSARHLPEHVAQQPDRLGIKKGFLAVDVIAAGLARSQGELTQGHGAGLEQFQQADS